MSRVLLTWELGLNLGHLTRLLPVAQQLREQGHTVLVASRDMQAAATVLGPHGISFIQSPHLPKGIALAHRASGYADILLSQGWSDRSSLWGLVQAWINFIRMYQPDRLILDYSPTVSLAARIAEIPTTLVGNGFEIPPEMDPLPCFPGFSWATPENAAKSEAVAVENANGVLQAFRKPPLEGLSELTKGQTKLLATYPELDHYGARTEATYIGPLLGGIKAPKVDWPAGTGPKIFACLRPDTANVKAILEALGTIPARVVCVATGFTREALQSYTKGNIRFSLGPVDLEPLLDANLCVTYGAEGTMLRFLMAGVPQLISPWHVETFMAARRIEAAGLGQELRVVAINQYAAETFERIVSDARLHRNSRQFASTKATAIRAPFDGQNHETQKQVERVTRLMENKMFS